jgi:hypothetical protein
MAVRGLLDGLTAIPAIMAEQDCTWEEAQRFWRISMEMEAERAEPSNVIYANFRGDDRPDPEAA